MLWDVSEVPVLYHPRFAAQYLEMAELATGSDAQLGIFGDVTALILALE